MIAVNKIGVGPVFDAREERMASREMQFVPAHMGNLDGRTRRRAGREFHYLAPDPAQARVAAMLEPEFGHELHADANAEERPGLAAHQLIQRLDHARQARKALAAV